MKRSVAGRRSRGGIARAVGMAAALLAGLLLAGCGLGPGDDAGDASLVVTRDYGAKVLVDEADLPVNESSNAMRLLDGEAGLETAYGGEYVQAVDGLAGRVEGGRSFDWFFSVNGIVAERGSAQFPVGGGDRVWWDYRDWTDAMEVGAVVGAYPAPFSTGYDNRGWGVEIDCLGDAAACGMVERQLEGDGVELVDRGENMTIRVGAWDQVRKTPEGRRIERGPAASGVFARFRPEATTASGAGGEPVWGLAGLDVRGEPVGEFGAGAGLVAAMRRSEDPPVWLVTGGSDEAVRQAAGALDPEYLERRYAALVSDGEVSSLPVP